MADTTATFTNQELMHRLAQLELAVEQVKSDLAVSKQAQAIAFDERDAANLRLEKALQKIEVLQGENEQLLGAAPTAPRQLKAEVVHTTSNQEQQEGQDQEEQHQQRHVSGKGPHVTVVSKPRGAFWNPANDYTRTAAATASASAPGADPDYKSDPNPSPVKRSSATATPTKTAVEIEEERLRAFDEASREFSFAGTGVLDPVRRVGSPTLVRTVELPSYVDNSHRRRGAASRTTASARKGNQRDMRVRIQHNKRAPNAAAKTGIELQQDRSVGHLTYEHYRLFGFAGHGARTAWAWNPGKPQTIF
ncbi:hypothetical protein NFJ02_38g97210 [Pycnococcus provasolii]